MTQEELDARAALIAAMQPTGLSFKQLLILLFCCARTTPMEL